MNEERRELCVIGAGTAGFAAAEEARAAGRDVVLVTGAEELGGTCILRGCMPAKTLLAAAQAKGEVDKAPEVGVEPGAARVDLAAIVRRKRALVDYFAQDRVHEIESYPLARGDARFVSSDALVVGERRIVAERFIVATGARIVLPAIPGLADVPTMTSTGVMEMTTLPGAVVVLGGGPIGCAFAQYFARLGSTVTLFQDAPELLRNEDPDVGTAVRASLGRDGVTVVVDADVRSAHRDGDATVVIADTPDGARRARCDLVFVATNRRPHVDALDLAAGEVSGDRARGIIVDDHLRSVSNPRVFAAGDVLARRSMVHTAQYAGALAARNAFAEQPESVDWAGWESHGLATDPQVAVAGLTERQCRAAGIEVDVAVLPASEVGEALVTGAAEGFVKMLVRRDDRRIVGVTMVLADAIDLAGAALVALGAGLTARRFAELPVLHPTMGELLTRVAEKLA